MSFKTNDPNEIKRVQCPWCQGRMDVPASCFGKIVECQGCGKKFVAKTRGGASAVVLRVVSAVMILLLPVKMMRLGLNMYRSCDVSVAQVASEDIKRYKEHERRLDDRSKRANEFLTDRNCGWLKNQKMNDEVREAFSALESGNQLIKVYIGNRLPFYRNYKGSDKKDKSICEFFVAWFESRLKICNDVEKVCELVQDMRILTFSSDSKREKGGYERTREKYSSEMAAKGIDGVVKDLSEKCRDAVDQMHADEKEMYEIALREFEKMKNETGGAGSMTSGSLRRGLTRWP